MEILRLNFCLYVLQSVPKNQRKFAATLKDDPDTLFVNFNTVRQSIIDKIDPVFLKLHINFFTPPLFQTNSSVKNIHSNT